jgi:radical SAM protein with 4Fe4S-binding SPASM domain
MFSVSNILCDHAAGNERLRYGHRAADRAPGDHSPRKSPQKGPRNAPRPVVVWAVTRACNLKCVHCYASADASAAPHELSFDEGCALLDELKAYGAPAVLFSGGEPLVREDTLDLIAYARKIGLPCTLSTNGLLIDDPVAGRLAELGVKYVGISLDGIGKTHDKLRGQRGAFDRTLEAIRTCQRHGLKVGVRFTVHRFNLNHLDDIFALCLRETIDRLCVYHLAYAGRGGKMQLADLTADQTRQAVDRIFELTREYHDRGTPLEVLTVGNHADAAYAVLALEQTDPQAAAAVAERLASNGGNRSGANICSISPQGDVHYDQFSWHYAVGNIRHQTFREIWGESPDDFRLQQLRNRPAGLPDRCRGCRFLNLCNGNLRTRAESATGDWLGVDPSCYLKAEEIATERELAAV